VSLVGQDGQGSRFELRDWQPSDAPRLAAAWAEPSIAEWNAVPPDPSIAFAEHWIAGVEQRWRERRSIDKVIVQDNELVGEVGLSSFNDRHRGALIGYWLFPDARGRGLAGAAVRVLVDWAWTDLGLNVIAARCHRSNIASHQVARTAGFTLAAEETEVLVFRAVRAATESC
jgi:RimJ/RimL family protein N-acetyltransferase